MIEIQYDYDNGRRAYRHDLCAEDYFELEVADEPREAVNVSDNGVAYRRPATGEDAELVSALLRFKVSDSVVEVYCNLQRTRTEGDLYCCEITALSERQQMMLSRFIMQCQKSAIRRLRG